MENTLYSTPSFKIPIRSMALCETPPDPKQFHVLSRTNTSTLPESTLLSSLDCAISTLSQKSKNCLLILSNAVFDPLYSILYHLDSMTL